MRENKQVNDKNGPALHSARTLTIMKRSSSKKSDDLPLDAILSQQLGPDGEGSTYDADLSSRRKTVGFVNRRDTFNDPDDEENIARESTDKKS